MPQLWQASTLSWLLRGDTEEVEGVALALSQGKGVLCVFFLCEFSDHFLI